MLIDIPLDAVQFTQLEALSRVNNLSIDEVLLAMVVKHLDSAVDKLIVPEREESVKEKH